MFGVYLAGAIENISHKEAETWRDKTKAYFNNSNDKITVISPMDFYSYEFPVHKTEEEIFRYETRLISKCNLVLANLSNLRKSVGTCDEIMYAYMNNIPVIGFLESDHEFTRDELNKEIHPWKVIQIDRIESGENAMINAINYINEYYGVN